MRDDLLVLQRSSPIFDFVAMCIANQIEVVTEVYGDNGPAHTRVGKEATLAEAPDSAHCANNVTTKRTKDAAPSTTVKKTTHRSPVKDVCVSFLSYMLIVAFHLDWTSLQLIAEF